MIYFANPSTQAIRDHIAAGHFGTIRTPNSTRPSQNVPNTPWCADNGCYTDNWNEDRWLAWLQRNSTDVDTCIFATAPDVVGSAFETLELSRRWLPHIRKLGYPPAYVAQDGIQHTTIPWDDFDALFIGGTTNFKLGPHARTAAHEAKTRGKWLHVGRVSSLKRYRFCQAINADSCDSTFLTFGPDILLPELMGWINHPQHAFDLDFT